MSEILDNVFGYIGSSLLIISMIPQLYRTYTTKSAKDISPIFLGIQLFTAGTLLTYSILIFQVPLIYGNSGILVELLMLCYMKWRWRNRIHETPHNLVDMHNRFEKYNQNLHKIIENREHRVRKRHLLHENIDLEIGKQSRSASISISNSNASSPRISDSESLKSEDENEVFNEILGATMKNYLYETSL